MMLLPALLAPFETLFWWSGWSAKQTSEQLLHGSPEEQPYADQTHHSLVYLSGIADSSGDTLNPKERALLDQVQQRLPGAIVVGDVFPYSVTNRALTGQRVFAWLWRRLSAKRLEGGSVLVGLMNLRTLFHVTVSSDYRYGPMDHAGTAQVLLDGLMRRGYQPGSGKPVPLIGSSGGAQIAIGAVTYLKPAIQAPVWVISLGGVMSSDPGLDHVEHMYHLYGSADSLRDVGPFMFPSRWPIAINSHGNRAAIEGRILIICLGPMEHAEAGGSLDAGAPLPDGTNYLDKTAETMANIIRRGPGRFQRSRQTGADESWEQNAYEADSCQFAALPLVA